MKKSILIYFLLVLNIAQSQNLITYPLLPPESKAHSDLYFLKEELKGKRLVMLGEMTHMYGNIFEMKARVIEYLHEELGFNTIAMESPMYGLWLMNKIKEPTQRELNQAIYPVWSGTSEFQRLVNYIIENNIKVIGFDPQMDNSLQFIDDFFDYCHDQNINIRLNEDDMGILIEGILEVVEFDSSDIEYVDLENELLRIIDVIDKLESTEFNYYWAQFVKSILACSKDAYYNTEYVSSNYFVDNQLNYRDKQMADNLLSYMERNMDEKIVLWADNIHIINSMKSIEKDTLNAFIPMGSYIKSALRDECYSLATLHANDSIFANKKWHATPIREGSFEYRLKSLDQPYLFVSSNQKEMRKMQQNRMLSYVDFMDSRLDQMHDGYIFIENATIPKNEIEALMENQADKRSVNAVLAKGTTIFIKSRVIDAKTKEPVPYANIILKNEEIYRISDINGDFEIPANDEMLLNATVEVSSMGYNLNSILLKKLKATIPLSPSLEVLDAVNIVGFRDPKKVLKKAIKKIKTNNPTSPFNYRRYGKVLINKNDETILDLELITKEYNRGYNKQWIATKELEQIKWNKNVAEIKMKFASQYYIGREDAIQYANIIHKRKYKKFDLEFLESDKPEDQGLYIMAFKTDREGWNYTNRGYPTTYSGKIFINKEDFAIVKVIQHWETTLNRDEFKIHFEEYEGFEDKMEYKSKTEIICIYSKMPDQKYYATNYYDRTYSETTDLNDSLNNYIKIVNSFLFDIETEDVVEIEFYYRNKEPGIDKIKYDKVFWDAFDSDDYLK